MQLQLSRGDRLSLKEKPKKKQTNTFTGFYSIPTINLIKSKKLKIDFFKRFLSHRFQVSKMDFFWNRSYYRYFKIQSFRRSLKS